MGLTNDSRPVPRACGGKTAHPVMGIRLRKLLGRTMEMMTLAMKMGTLARCAKTSFMMDTTVPRAARALTVA